MQKLQVPSSSIPGIEVFTDVTVTWHNVEWYNSYTLFYIIHLWAINVYSQIYFQITALISNIKGDAVCSVHNTRPSSASTLYTQVIYSYHTT
jgi:hypothetical protein